MKILKVAGWYFVGFFVSLLLLDGVGVYIDFIESPYKSVEDIVYGSIYFAFFFAFFDQFVLKRFLSE